MKKISFFLFLFFCNLFFTQNFEIKIHNLDNGLNANYINDYAIDHKENIWLATNMGLKKFDGYNFINYNIPHYNRKEIKKISFHENHLYILYKEGTLFDLDLISETSKKYSEEKILDFYIAPQKSVLLKSNFNIEVRKGKKRINYHLKFHKKIPTQDSQNIFTIIFFKNAIYFTLPDMGMFRLKKNKIETINNSTGEIPGGYRDRFKIINNQLFFIGFSRPLIIDKTLTRFLKFKEKNIKFSSDMTIKNNTAFYIKDDVSLLIESNNSTSAVLKDLKNVELRKFFFLGNSIYVTTNKGLYEITKRNRIIESFTLNNYVSVKRKIIEDGNRILFFGFPNIISKENNTIERLTHITETTYDAVKVNNKIYFTSDNRNGILIADKQFKNINPLERNTIKHPYSIYYDADTKLLYYGDNEYLYYFDSQSETTNKIPTAFKGFNIKCIVKDRKQNRLLVGTEKGLFMVNLKNKKTDRLLSNKIIGDLLIDEKANSLWIGHENGILWYNLSSLQLKKSLSFKVLQNPRVTCLLQDSSKRIWGSSYSGLFGYDTKTNSLLEIKSTKLINKEYNYKSACKLKDGRLIFGGLDGYDVIDPKKFGTFSPVSSGKISGYHLIKPALSTYHDYKDNETIKYNTQKEYLRIYLTTGSKTNKQNCHFQYKLNSTNWIELKEQYIDLIGLGADDYTLLIRGFDEMGRTILFKPVKIKARVNFHKSDSFIFGLIFVSFILLIYLFKNFYTRLKLKNEIYEKISMDLHDEVGTILSKTNLFISQDLSMNQELKNKLQNNIKQANFGLRANINSLKDYDKQLIYIYYECIEVMESFLNIRNIPYKYSFGGNTRRKISKSLYKDLKLCFYEIFNNTMKYSSTNDVVVSFIEENKILTITILEKNNFINFDEIIYGNGLKNIQKRIERNNGKIVFISEKETKTYSIIITIKL